VKKGWNGVEKEAARSWGGWFLGKWLMGGAGLWACREPFHVQFDCKPSTLAESIDNQNSLKNYLIGLIT